MPKKKRKPFRKINDSFLVATASGVSTKTSLHLSAQDRLVLEAVGAYLTKLANQDLVRAVDRVIDWPTRKQQLTPYCSSRWAGSMTRTNNDLVKLAKANQFRYLQDLKAAIKHLDQRLARSIYNPQLPISATNFKALTKAGKVDQIQGYTSPFERFQKQQRRIILTAKLAQTESDYDQGLVSVCRGGKDLLKNRNNLDALGSQYTYESWYQTWVAQRRFLTANGEAGKNYGNETIRVNPLDGTLTLDLPPSLESLANQGSKDHYTLAATADFKYLAQEWTSQTLANKAVSYTISENPENQRWYLSASWTKPGIATETAASDLTAVVKPQRVLALDFNAQHFSGRIIDEAGNPVGPAIEWFFEIAGLPTETRDGHLREVFSQIIKYCLAHQVDTIALEDLGFEDSKTREKFGHQKGFRKLISNFPYTIIKNRLVNMASKVGIKIMAVDPAYTSQWGNQHWLSYLNLQKQTKAKATTHMSAAIVIGRRVFKYRARRKPGVVSREQSISRQGLPVGSLGLKTGQKSSSLRASRPRSSLIDIQTSKALTPRLTTRRHNRLVSPRIFSPSDKPDVRFVRF